MPELICKILHIGKSTYYQYQKKEYSIIHFLKQFTKEELEELLETGKIARIEKSNIQDKILGLLGKKYLMYFISEYSSIKNWDNHSQMFYFGLLNYLKHHHNDFSSFKSIALSYSLMLEKNDNYYDIIEALNKRIIPTLEFLDSIDGMYFYLSMIVQDDLIDLTKIDNLDKEYNRLIEKGELVLLKNETIDDIKESTIQIQKFKEFTN